MTALVVEEMDPGRGGLSVLASMGDVSIGEEAWPAFFVTKTEAQLRAWLKTNLSKWLSYASAKGDTGEDAVSSVSAATGAVPADSTLR